MSDINTSGVLVNAVVFAVYGDNAAIAIDEVVLLGTGCGDIPNCVRRSKI